MEDAKRTEALIHREGRITSAKRTRLARIFAIVWLDVVKIDPFTIN
jgi:hypothetical protein